MTSPSKLSNTLAVSWPSYNAQHLESGHKPDGTQIYSTLFESSSNQEGEGAEGCSIPTTHADKPQSEIKQQTVADCLQYLKNNWSSSSSSSSEEEPTAEENFFLTQPANTRKTQRLKITEEKRRNSTVPLPLMFEKVPTDNTPTIEITLSSPKHEAKVSGNNTNDNLLAVGNTRKSHHKRSRTTSQAVMKELSTLNVTPQTTAKDVTPHATAKKRTYTKRSKSEANLKNRTEFTNITLENLNLAISNPEHRSVLTDRPNSLNNSNLTSSSSSTSDRIPNTDRSISGTKDSIQDRNVIVEITERFEKLTLNRVTDSKDEKKHDKGFLTFWQLSRLPLCNAESVEIKQKALLPSSLIYQRWQYCFEVLDMYSVKKGVTTIFTETLHSAIKTLIMPEVDSLAVGIPIQRIVDCISQIDGNCFNPLKSDFKKEKLKSMNKKIKEILDRTFGDKNTRLQVIEALLKGNQA